MEVESLTAGEAKAAYKTAKALGPDITHVTMGAGAVAHELSNVHVNANGKLTSHIAAESPGASALVAEGVAIAKPKQPTDKKDKPIRALNTIDSVGNGIFMAEFAGMPAAWALRKVGAEKGAVSLQAAFKAIRTTPINKLRHLRLYYAKAVKELAAERKKLFEPVDGVTAGVKDAAKVTKKVNPKHAKKLLILEGMEDSATKTMKDNGIEKIEAFEKAIALKPKTPNVIATKFDAWVKTPAKGTITRFENTAVGRHIEDGLQNITHWRANRATKHYTKALSKADEMLTKHIPTGNMLQNTWNKVANFCTGKKMPAVDLHPDLAPIADALKKAATAAPHEVEGHITAARAALKIASDAAPIKGAHADRIAKLGEYLGQSARASENAVHLHGLKSKSLTEIAGNAWHSLGNAKLFGALIAVGTAAGIGAAVMTSRKHGREEKAAFEQLAADVGDPNSKFLQSIKMNVNAEKHGRVAGGFATNVGNIVNGVWMASADMAGGAGHMAMAATMVLPMAGQALIKNNAPLDAYVHLNQAEAGTIRLSEPDKLACVAQLVAAVPSVKAHGGMLNTLTRATAEEIIARRSPVRDIVKTLANEAAFTALAAKVYEARKAAAEAKAAEPAAKAEPTVANDNHAATPAAPSVAKETHAAKPELSSTMRVGADGKLAGDKPLTTTLTTGAVHDGKVVTMQKSVSA